MTTEDKLELSRLCAILGALEGKAKEKAESEALKKAALALSVAYIHGYKSEIDDLYLNLDVPLSDSEKAHLVRLGLDPGK